MKSEIIITQNSYYFVFRHFLQILQRADVIILLVSENNRGIRRKVLEIIQHFGLWNFLFIAAMEFYFFLILKSKVKQLNCFTVSDGNLNNYLNNLLKNETVSLIISIGCPCKIDITIGQNIDLKLYNLHGGILPFQKGRFSPIKSVQNGDKYLGVTLHKISEEFDGGEILSQTFFKTKNSNYLEAYNSVLRKSRKLLDDYFSGTTYKLPREILVSFKKD